MKKIKDKHVWLFCCSGRLFWGLLLLVLGVWFLFKELGFISLNISIWPIILIILGLWIILKRNRCY